ncbi:site-specific integrase [Cryobacterium sp. Sr8]|uniref:site-specific integrase n=1 Tax=Cryobacterium sp. Sr8 TaxID=1259203 RepID=UPI00106B286E|nr:site-specific integrase [Cryobacterium sp. Sr8]TFD74881.1 site-specific integrase [Cryobacterium sp. Sr8]
MLSYVQTAVDANRGIIVSRYGWSMGETARSSYRPNIDETTWSAIEAFVTTAVTDATPRVAYSATELMGAVSRLAAWCHTNGIALDQNHVFAAATIERHVKDGLDNYSDASRGNRRSQLRRVGEALLGNAPLAPARFTAAEPLRPYSPADIAQFSIWVKAQTTPELQADARTIISLGLGAGLAASEIGALRAADVISDKAGVRVRVAGSRPREVQVRREREEALRSRATELPDDAYLVRPARTSDAKNFVSNLVTRSDRPERGPQTQRMRATWLVHHLSAATPVAVLMEAAGIQSLDALARYVQFIPPVRPASAREASRGD